MSRFIFFGLLFSAFVAYNRNLVFGTPPQYADVIAVSPKFDEAQKSKSNNFIYFNDTSGLRLLGALDTVYAQSVMETNNEPVTARYLLKTTRWGDTLAAFQNTYRAIIPVPYELFLPIETTPEFPFPHPNAAPFSDSIYPFKIVPIKNDQRFYGITTFDLALMARHVLGIQPFTSPYKLIAADVNKDGSVDGSDILQIRRFILHIDTMFRHVPHWVFIPKTYVMPAIVPPIDSIPQAYYFNSYSSHIPNPFEFVTIKMGDVNNSFHDTTQFRSVVQERSDKKKLVLTTENIQLEKGNSYELRLKCTTTEQFIAMQGTLNLGTEGGEFESISSDNLTNFGEQNVNNIKNQVVFSWNDASDKVFRKNENILTLRIKANRNGKLSEILTLNNDLSESLVYTEGGETRKIELHFDEAARDFYVYQNEPNPFVAETSLKIEINAKNDAAIPTKCAIFDENGHLLFQNAQLLKNGIHLLRLDANEMGLTKAGIYFLKVETATGQQTIKLLKM